MPRIVRQTYTGTPEIGMSPWFPQNVVVVYLERERRRSQSVQRTTLWLHLGRLLLGRPSVFASIEHPTAT